jgi:hypothetical protein
LNFTTLVLLFLPAALFTLASGAILKEFRRFESKKGRHVPSFF